MHILLAVDGSDAALQACRLVGAYDSAGTALQVTLLNVQRPALHLDPGGGLQQPLLTQALLDAGHRQLEAAQSVLASTRVAPEPVVRIGRPADTLLEEAAARQVDLLVLGSGRQGILGGYAIGSVALRVAPAAPCPVVMVRDGARLPAALGRRLRVTAPVDGSPESQQAVARLAACAPLMGELDVDLVHFQPGISLAGAILPPHDDVLRAWGSQDADAALAGPAQALAAAGIRHTLHRESGAPDNGIADFARAHGAELIAMATRGRGAMHHLLMGSVALRTAHASDVPVALLR